MFREFHHQVRGRGHAAEGTPCQDRTAYLTRAGVQVACLADGAGSAAQSQHGAHTVVREGCRLLAARFHEYVSRDDGAQIKREIVDELGKQLEKTARRQRCEARDLASTFLAVAVSGDRFIAAHVGDGVIGYLKAGALKVVSAPDNVGIANQTTFVTSEAAAASMRLLRGSAADVAGFLLMSDGAETTLYNQKTQQLATACRKIIDLLGAGGALSVPLSRLQIRRLLGGAIRKGTKDDCGLVVLARELPAV